jgi:hypothetical protein
MVSLGAPMKDRPYPFPGELLVFSPIVEEREEKKSHVQKQMKYLSMRSFNVKQRKERMEIKYTNTNGV